MQGQNSQLTYKARYTTSTRTLFLEVSLFECLYISFPSYQTHFCVSLQTHQQSLFNCKFKLILISLSFFIFFIFILIHIYILIITCTYKSNFISVNSFFRINRSDRILSHFLIRRIIFILNININIYYCCC